MSKRSMKPGNMLYPVPVVMVSCRKPGEKANIITIAWAGTVCSSPAMVSISVRPERYSYNIIDETGEFVINLVTKKLTWAADWCGVRSGKDYDKFYETGLHESVSSVVSCPGIEESPVNIECRVVNRQNYGSHTVFTAEVVAVNADSGLYDETDRFNLNDAGLTAYSHGRYFLLGEEIGSFGYSVKKPEKKKRHGS